MLGELRVVHAFQPGVVASDGCGPVHHRSGGVAHQRTPHGLNVAAEIAPEGLHTAAAVCMRSSLRVEIGRVGGHRVLVVEALDLHPPLRGEVLARTARPAPDANRLRHRPMQGIVVGGVEAMLLVESAGVILPLVVVPREHGLAGGVDQHPAVAGIHAVLVEQVAGDVVALSISVQ